MAESQHHKALIDHACRVHGWTTVKCWRKVFTARCQDNPEWASEVADVDIVEALESASLIPDAWRMVVERNDVLILEFLEVEVEHPMNRDKHTMYELLWWAFDSSSSFDMRVYVMDRFGIVRPYLTIETIANVMKWAQ